MRKNANLNSKRYGYKIPIYIFFFAFSLLFILPLLLIVAISFTAEADLPLYGYQMFPKQLVTTAYEFIFNSPESLLRGYGVTISFALVHTTLTIVLEALMGYALSRPNFSYKTIIRVILLITIFFKGGIVPTYIIRTQVLGLQNNMFVYFLPNVAAMTVFVFAAFFRGLPESLFESAKLDGAGEMKCFAKIAVPLSLPILATYYLTTLLTCWNDYENSLYYITEPKLYQLQYYLQLILKEATMLRQIAEQMPQMQIDPSAIAPIETLRFAICVLATLPMMIVFPLFQRFFSKGITVGSVKG